MIINNSPCILKSENSTTNTYYKFVITFISNTSDKYPNGFITNKLEIVSNVNYIVLESVLNNFVPAEYKWQAFDESNNPIGSEKKFMKINVKFSNDREHMPILQIHGFTSDARIWDVLNLTGYSMWQLEYPNTGEVRKSAWALSKAIQHIKDSSLYIFTKLNVLSHSMGGLVTRAYTVNMGRDLLGNIANYNNDINCVAFLACPNLGGRYAYIARYLNNLIPFPINLFSPAMLDLNPFGDFVRELKITPIETQIKYLAIAGFNSNFVQWYLDTHTGNSNPRISLEDLFLIAGLLNDAQSNDVLVNVVSAISDDNGFFSQYKFIDRHHGNIYNHNLQDLKNWLVNFYLDGQIVSDDYNSFRYSTLWGRITGFIGNDRGDGFPSGFVELYPKNSDNPFVSIIDRNGYYTFKNLPIGKYVLKTNVEGFRNDSLSIILDTLALQVNQNMNISADTSYLGPTECLVTINDDVLFTSSLNVTLNISALRASNMIISDKIDFVGASWQPYNTSVSFSFSDTNIGSKTVFIKFRSSEQIESSVLFDNIMYKAQSPAQLNVTSSSSGGLIFVNGANCGFLTNHSFNNIPYDNYMISILKSGCSSVPNYRTLDVLSPQVYNLNFDFINAPPQPVRKLQYQNVSDTLRLSWIAPSDADLMKVRITYRTDNRFPANPDDGNGVYNNINIPDNFYDLTLLDLTSNVDYYFSVFSIDSLSSISKLDTVIRTSLIGIVNQQQIPKEYNLYNSYPNPFNPISTVRFDIPKTSYIRITIFDVLGQEITKIVNQEMNPGSYKIDWDASNYPSGVYFYKMEAGEFTDSKKMILIR